MIVVDTSALIAIVVDEPASPRLTRQFQTENLEILISAGTIAEALIVASGRKVSADMELLLDSLDCTVVPVTDEAARRVGDAYRQWGKGFHPAALNFGDCFAYALAKERGCPLLFIGNDFSKTDIKPALPAEEEEG